MDRNADITALRDALRQRMNRLLVLQEEARVAGDVDLFSRLGLQILEVEHRMRMLGRLEFAAASTALEAKLAPIESATKELDKAIGQIQRFDAFVKSISKVLGLVDKVIDFLA